LTSDAGAGAESGQVHTIWDDRHGQVGLDFFQGGAVLIADNNDPIGSPVLGPDRPERQPSSGVLP